jgi:hypothetical protein
MCCPVFPVAGVLCRMIPDNSVYVCVSSCEKSASAAVKLWVACSVSMRMVSPSFPWSADVSSAGENAVRTVGNA